MVDFAVVVVASGSRGTHAGLAVGLEKLLPECERRRRDRILQCVRPADEDGGDPLALASCAPLTLWDEHFATGTAIRTKRASRQ
uniref:D-cysteine desulfhydrase n=1 Tax=Erwinia amylovora ATCC BAA-2158 TaxID=889211 RepID=E5B6I8_ERWAM|nr:D-cysteine desulfhydrase [Erwinia amylovora ATCC BAA-2158]